MTRFDTPDPDKDAENQRKHGISFDEAQALWRDPHRIEIQARSDAEPRFVVIGRIGNKLWSAIITYRHDQEVRLISVRRAHENEARLYRNLLGEGADPTEP